MRTKNTQVEFRVLRKNKRACCVCHDPEKEIQLHHIDGNRADTTEENLAVLCLTHHSQATAGLQKGKAGFGRKLTPQEVREHKQAWEAKVAQEFKVEKRVAPQRDRKQLELLYKFDVMKAKNEIMSLIYLPLGKRIRSLIKEKLDYLTHFSLFEELFSGLKLRGILLNALSEMAIASAGDNYLSKTVLSAVLDLHLHLIGPPDVPIRKEDKLALLRSMEIVETIGSDAAWLVEGESSLKKALETILELAGIAHLYGFKDGIRRAMKILDSVRKEISEYQKPRARKERVEAEKEKRRRLVDQTLKEIEALLA